MANFDAAKFKNTLLKVKDNRITAMILPLLWLVVLCVVFMSATINPETGESMFLSEYNISIIIQQSLIVATIATGASFIYGTGNVNLAMGATAGLIAAIAAKVFEATESIPSMIIVALIAGIIISILEVIISSKFKVKVLFVTVVMMTLLLALQTTVLDNATISIPYEVKTMFRDSNFSLKTFIIFFVACFVVFNFTKVGRTIRFIGTNDNCSKATGVINDRYLMIAFIISGIGAALGAIMTIARSGSVNYQTLNTMNMDVLLAIVLGGMSVFGGSKSYIYAATIGAFTVTILNNGLTMIGVDPAYIQGIRGIFFLVLVVASQTRTDLLPEKD